MPRWQIGGRPRRPQRAPQGAGRPAARGGRAAAVVAAAALALALAACSFDYEQATVSESLGEKIPDTILERFSQTVVRDGRPTLVMEAAEARTYRREQAGAARRGALQGV